MARPRVDNRVARDHRTRGIGSDDRRGRRLGVRAARPRIVVAPLAAVDGAACRGRGSGTCCCADTRASTRRPRRRRMRCAGRPLGACRVRDRRRHRGTHRRRAVGTARPQHVWPQHVWPRHVRTQQHRRRGYGHRRGFAANRPSVAIELRTLGGGHQQDVERSVSRTRRPRPGHGYRRILQRSDADARAVPEVRGRQGDRLLRGHHPARVGNRDTQRGSCSNEFGGGQRANGRGSSVTAPIGQWVTSHYAARTVGGYTVYDLSARPGTGTTSASTETTATQQNSDTSGPETHSTTRRRTHHLARS